ncbi:HDOD domain-containing protein [Desulfovibrio cuneatus]|uniref:HDOD domain-containing protein n=1 Tax=Desulfovibrio cuneatus TaxID=159728 RepID=UPI000486494F|nr:HDOD domain-containing protein [Desulfovibrio cuneatus]
MPFQSETSLDEAFRQSLHLAFPPVLVRLLQALVNPSPSFPIIANFLRMDPMLTSRVLHIVNAPNYGFESKIADIERAAIAIGSNELFRLVISLSMQQRLQPKTSRARKMLFGDWRMAMWSALAAEGLAEKWCPDQKNLAYLAGILKDLPLFLALCRETLPDFLLKEVPLGTLPSQAQFTQEEQFWGVSHPDLSGSILLFWGLPPELAVAVHEHHELASADTKIPLSQAVIYATRWAELLLSPQAEAAELIAFELRLARVVEGGKEQVARIKEECAVRFDRLMEQLGIVPEAFSHDFHHNSLVTLEHYYFLALETLGGRGEFSLAYFGKMLQQQLSAFWHVASWDFFMQISPNTEGYLLKCEAGRLAPVQRISREEVLKTARPERIPLMFRGGDIGFLALAKQSAKLLRETPLSLFMHVLGIGLGERLLEQAGKESANNTLAEMLPTLTLDASGIVQAANKAMLGILRIPFIPEHTEAVGLLRTRLGVQLSGWAKAEPQGTFAPQAWLEAVAVPSKEATSPGRTIPMCITHVRIPAGGVVQCVPVPGVAPAFGVHVANPQLLDAFAGAGMMESYLLDDTGLVLWASAGNSVAQGKCMFAFSRAASGNTLEWNATWLKSQQGVTRVVLHFLENGKLVEKKCLLSPLITGHHRNYLLTVSQCEGAEAENTAPMQADAVTGLLGYSQCCIGIGQALEKMQTQGSQPGLLVCDVVGMASLNEKHGYQAGDAVLRRIGACLLTICPPDQGQPFRLGGDDFALLLHNTSEENMHTMASLLHEELAARSMGILRVNVGLLALQPGVHVRDQIIRAKSACARAAGEPSRTFMASTA